MDKRQVFLTVESTDSVSEIISNLGSVLWEVGTQKNLTDMVEKGDELQKISQYLPA